MKLLITTQAVDSSDPVLGFFVRWIAEFAEHAESVVVLTLRVGAYDLPSNVEVISLRPEGRSGRLMTAFSFLRLAWSRRHAYDAVFVHMNPEYAVLAGFMWRALGKRVGLWYVHRQVTAFLRLAVLFVHVVYSASKESFRLPTQKLRVVGHGIDIDAYGPAPAPPVRDPAFISIGRIAPAKGYEFMLEALALLPHGSLELYGVPARAEDSDYARMLVARMETLGLTGRATFKGAVAHADVPKALSGMTLFLHASRGTGSLDKAALEAMLAGVPVISSSRAFAPLLAPHGLYVEGGPRDFADSIAAYLERPEAERVRIAEDLRSHVRENHALSQLVPRLMQGLEG